MKKVFSVLLCAIMLLSFVNPSQSIKAISTNKDLSFANQRLPRDQKIISSLKLPNEIKYTITKVDEGTVEISFDFPKSYSQSQIIDVIEKVQAAIASDKSINPIVLPDLNNVGIEGGPVGTITNYYFSGSQNFTGRYGETIYNSTYGQLTSTRYEYWYYMVVTGTSAGVVNNISTHYSGLKIDTTVHIWGVVVGGSASNSGFSLSIFPGVVAEFHREWNSTGRYIILDWGQLITYALNAYKLGVDNTVWVDNSGFVDPYHIYVPRWLYEF
jgi:hypothetical protein